MPLRKETVYIMFSDMNARYRFRATKFVLEKGFTPLYPSMERDFFDVQGDSRTGTDEKSSVLKKCEQIWVFGEANASMWDQINTAKKLRKKIRYFNVYGGEFVEKEEKN